jgi:hypothetical protein
MKRDVLSDTNKLTALKEALNQHFDTNYFTRCKSMGDVVKRQLKQTLQKNLLLIPKTHGKAND